MRQTSDSLDKLRDYISARRNLFSKLAEFPQLLSTLPRYKDIPFTREQREAAWEETGLRPLQWAPEEEILFMLREMKVEEVRRYNEDLGRWQTMTTGKRSTHYRHLADETLKDQAPDIYSRIIEERERHVTVLEKDFRNYQRTFTSAYRGINRVSAESVQ